MSKKIVLVLNGVTYFISHRLPIAVELKRQVYEVHIVCPDAKPADFDQHGFTYHQIEISRKGMNPFAELMVIAKLYRLFKQIKPDLVHLVTIKPYLYGGIAARLAGVPDVVSAVAGLGIVFSQSNLKKLLRTVLYPLFKLAFGHSNQNVIFQNKDDKQTLVDWINLPNKKHGNPWGGVFQDSCHCLHAKPLAQHGFLTLFGITGHDGFLTAHLVEIRG